LREEYVDRERERQRERGREREAEREREGERGLTKARATTIDCNISHIRATELQTENLHKPFSYLLPILHCAVPCCFLLCCAVDTC
jgi:hypothetical protein